MKKTKTFFMNETGSLGFVDPKNVVNQLAIQKGESAVDFGCGAGYFSCAFAEAVGQDGHVIAFDILPASLEAVMSRARTLGLTNVSARRANLEKEGGSGLDPHSQDWVIIKDMLFQNQKKDIIVYEAARVLRPSGKLFVMEWNKDTTFVGPEKSLRMEREALEEILHGAGFAIAKTLDVGEYHFAYLAEKKS